MASSGALLFGAVSTYHTARGLRVTQAVLLSAAGVWSFFQSLGPCKGNQAGDQSGQRSHLVESSLGKEAKCARSGVVWARGRRPDQPRLARAEAGDTPRQLWPYGSRMLLRLWSFCHGLTRAVASVGLSQALLTSRGPPCDSRRWWASNKQIKKVGR